LAAARRLYELLDKHEVTGVKGELILFDVYLDQTMPAAADWREIHRPYLEKARALIVVCTPDVKIDDGPEDWVHKEIGWWLDHRNTVPILVDPLRQGILYVPPRSENAGRKFSAFSSSSPNGLACRLPSWSRRQAHCDVRVVGNILPSGASIYDAELKAER
jgi:hypothetical protein